LHSVRLPVSSMTHTLLSVLLIALLYVRYSSAVRSSESEQYPYPSSPVPLFGQSTPSPVPVSEHPRDPNPPRALACFINQLQRSPFRCAENDCMRGGGRCLPDGNGRRCAQHVVYSGAAFPDSVLRMPWNSWSSTKNSCRGCGCLYTPKRRQPKRRESSQRVDSEESHTSDRIMLFGVDLSKKVRTSS
jgi:hypothetical protein